MTSPLTPTEWICGTLPKVGNRPEENEDATAAATDGLRFAIADGATEGWESGTWASHLSQAFLHNPPTPATFASFLTEVRRTWVPRATAGPLPWYAAVKEQEGSYAALAGLELLPSSQSAGWSWRAVAVGDSCLLHIRDQELIASFPYTSVASFGNRPQLVPSSSAATCPEPEWLAGRAVPGDLFLIATDAVAARLLNPDSLIFALVAVQESLQTRELAPLLDWLREVQTTKNDDVSLIGVQLRPVRT